MENVSAKENTAVQPVPGGGFQVEVKVMARPSGIINIREKPPLMDMLIFHEDLKSVLSMAQDTLELLEDYHLKEDEIEEDGGSLFKDTKTLLDQLDEVRSDKKRLFKDREKMAGQIAELKEEIHALKQRLGIWPNEKTPLMPRIDETIDEFEARRQGDRQGDSALKRNDDER